MKIIYIISILVLSLTTTPLMARKRIVTSPTKLKKIKNEISSQQKNILKIKKQILSIESELANANEKYVFAEKDKTRLDANIYQANLEIAKMKMSIETELVETRRAFKSLIVASLNKEKNSKSILREKILTDVSKIKLSELTKLLNNVKKMEIEVHTSQRKLNESYVLVGEISNLLSNMEAEKKILASNYLDKVQSNESLKEKYKKLKKSVKRIGKKIFSKKTTNIKLRFQTPLMKISSLDHDNKGITYKFRGSTNVLSTQSGKVIYSGPLSTYGNVVMIDHGNNTRSVLLGKFRPSILKGTRVNKGQIIGKATSRNTKAGSLYFEVRYKERVQNTFNLIEKKKYSRNNTSVKQINFQGT